MDGPATTARYGNRGVNRTLAAGDAAGNTAGPGVVAPEGKEFRPWRGKGASIGILGQPGSRQGRPYTEEDVSGAE